MRLLWGGNGKIAFMEKKSQEEKQKQSESKIFV